MAEVNLTIPQGTTWGYAWPLIDTDGQDIDLTGWTGRAQVRATATSATVLHEWSTALGNLTLADSTLTLLVDPDESSAWPWRTGRYDIELVDSDGRVARIAEGSIAITPEVTR